ncbi:MAG: hypothetical protein IMF08_06890 [Proteobacteria bacterium]|nr:hypothetical protein [Pseudomonadota bacterium]
MAKVIKATRFLGLVCVALAMFALPAAAQSASQSTPATTGLCDGLADATPGLQGLCVAMCEAQACEAEIHPITGEVEFGPSCEPSAENLLANYNKRAAPVDPPMPCVKVACPCWTQAELEDIGGGKADKCIGGPEIGGPDEEQNLDWAFLQAGAVDRGVRELAIASGLACASNEAGFSQSRFIRDLSADAYAVCVKTIADVCTARDIWPKK